MPMHGTNRGLQYNSNPFETLALEGGGWSATRSGRLTPGKDLVPIVQDAGWDFGVVRKITENLAPTWILSPDRPARS
jgi:hypothetical protein